VSWPDHSSDVVHSPQLVVYLFSHSHPLPSIFAACNLNDEEVCTSSIELRTIHRYSGGPCNLGAGFGRVRVTHRARTGNIDDEFKMGLVTLHAVEKLSGNCQIAMFEGVRNAAPMTQRMRTSKNDAAQANKLMIRQTLGYVTSRVRTASTVRAEETQPKANTTRYIGGVGRNNTGQPYEEVLTLSRATITQTALYWRCLVLRSVRRVFKVM